MCTKYEVCKPSNSTVKQVCLCGYGKKCSWQKVKAWIAVASNSKDMSIFLCCYGNKVSITASHKMDSCGLKGPVYQIRTS